MGIHDNLDLGIPGLNHQFRSPIPSTDSLKQSIDELVQRAFDTGVEHGRSLQRMEAAGATSRAGEPFSEKIDLFTRPHFSDDRLRRQDDSIILRHRDRDRDRGYPRLHDDRFD